LSRLAVENAIDLIKQPIAPNFEVLRASTPKMFCR
jgi:hypothetical protein